MIEGFRAMAAATGNYDVRASCEAKIRESEKTIQWFEQSLRELQKKQQGGAPGANSDAASVASAGSSGSAVSSSPYGGGARPSANASTSSSAISAYSRSESSTSTATQGTSVSSSHRNRVLPPTPGSLGATIEDSDRSLSMHAQGLPQPAFRDNGAAGLSIRRRGGYTNLGETRAL
jgi:classical protein kinase C